MGTRYQIVDLVVPEVLTLGRQRSRCAKGVAEILVEGVGQSLAGCEDVWRAYNFLFVSILSILHFGGEIG
jgi:hypothetical protein